MKWLDDFKRALIEKDFDAIERLIENIPQFREVEEQKLVLSLINEAKREVQKEKDQALKEMQKIQKSKKYINREKIYSFDMCY